tara:strand:+ start:4056 stop:4448 length:393 start_codon:yes stop_codon:yes gene_type:complete
MTLSEHVKKFVLISIIVLVIDLFWLSLFLGKYFGKMVLKIQGETMNVNKNIASLSYLFIILSIYYFIVMKDNGKMHLDAFLLGLFIYGIFEFTSGAIFKKWNILPLFVDTLWGGILYLITYVIYKLFYKN